MGKILNVIYYNGNCLIIGSMIELFYTFWYMQIIVDMKYGNLCGKELMRRHAEHHPERLLPQGIGAAPMRKHESKFY